MTDPWGVNWELGGQDWDVRQKSRQDLWGTCKKEKPAPLLPLGLNGGDWMGPILPDLGTGSGRRPGPPARPTRL